MKVTLDEIAQALNVSAMTVSRALRGASGVSAETSARVREYARKVNYRPNLAARALAAKRASVLGAIIPNLRHSFWLEMVMGVEQVAHESGYHVFLSHSADDPVVEREEMWTLVGRRVAAVLIASCDPDGNADTIRDLVDEGVHVLMFDRHGRDPIVPGVYADDVGGAARATEHLVSLGYRRIAHLAGDLKFSPARARLSGYQQKLAEYGLDPIVQEAGFGEENGYLGMQALLRRARVDAVFVSHDPSAIGALQAALNSGLRVPEDVALVGFGNMDCAAHVAVPLTTVDQPRTDLGHALARLALRIIAGDADPSTTVVLPTGFVVRKSCGAHLRGRTP
ncbi:MAG: LacI family transcriptional regulator [Chthonomonadales bacterium]|nr:LacI family transcriptional regulator [Chthonomonadales bacterium]